MKRIRSKTASKIFSVLASTFLIVGCVPTSALADLSNIADNINDQAKVLNENGSNQAAVNEDEDAALVEEPSDSNVAIESETQQHHQEAKQYTYRLIVEDPNFEQTIIRVEDTVLARYNNIVLLGFDNADQLEEAKAYYKDKSPIVSVDGAVGASSEDENLPDIDSVQSAEITKPQSAEDNPFAALEKTIKEEKEQEKAGVLENAAVRIQAMEVETTGQTEVDEKPLIALVDTGVYEDITVKDRLSVLGGNGVDDNGHGTLMAQTIYEENAEAEILSIKALDKTGHGSASAVYAAIELAIEKDAKIINCSFTGFANKGNSVIEKAVRDALDHNVVVIAAAGNGGYDAAQFTPGNVDGVVCVGAADGDQVRESSNRGERVNLYVEAPSTSYAAARVSALAAGGMTVDAVKGAIGVDVDANGIEAVVGDDGVELAVQYANWAVYSTDDYSLTFLYSASRPTDESFGKDVSKAWAGVYSWNEETYTSPSDRPWYGWSTYVRSVVFKNVVKPASTAYWFCGFKNLGATDFSMIDVSGVTNMDSMFDGCSGAAFNPDVSSWDTSRVTNMDSMFNFCSGAAFNPDVSRWDTSKVTNMAVMFYKCCGAAFNPDVSRWNTSSVTSMSHMFDSCSGAAFNPDVSRWNTSSVTTMYQMFSECSGAAFNPDVSSWDTSKVTEMTYMFGGCSGGAFNPDVSSWNTSKVTSMYATFSSCSGAAFNPDVSRWGTSSVTNMSFMFSGCHGAAFNPDVSKWDISSAMYMRGMFQNCYGAAFTSIDLSNWDKSSLIDITNMFQNCSSLTTIYAATDSTTNPAHNWTVQGTTTTAMTGTNVFTGCTNLVGGISYDSTKVTYEYAKVEGGYFSTLSKKITFKTGSTTMGTQNISGTANLTAASSLINVPVSSSYGWSFYGWATSTDTTTRTYTDGQSITPSADMTLYAIYSRTITFHYYSSASATSYSTDSRTQYYYNISDSAAGVGSVSTYALYTQSSYSWAPLGWVTSTSSTSASTSQTGGSTTTVSPGTTEGSTYYALYFRTATLSYDANEGTGTTPATTDTQKFVAGSGAQSLSLTLASNNFSRSGYGFSNWAAGSASGTQYTEGGSFPWQNTSWTSSDSYTMYAIWAGNPYSVAFDNNGGSGSMTTQTGFTYGTSQSLSSNEFSAPAASGGGWYFAGWATSQARASEGAIDYADAGNMTTGTTTSGDTVTLYAVWERNVEFKSGVAATTTTNITQLWNGSAGIAIISPTDTSAATISGWDKLGWRNDTTAGASDVSFNTSFSPDEAVYYAVYSRSATLSYQPGATSVTGISPTSSVQTQYYNAYGNLSTLSATLANNTYTRDWFAFTSWDLGEAGDTYEWTPALNSSADIVATALWEEVVPTPTGLDPARSALPVSVAGTMLVAAAFIASRKKKQGKVRSVVRSLNDFETFHSKKD